jgi:hypothetical protein
MIFFCSDNIKKFDLRKLDKESLIIDYNLKNCFYLKNRFININYKKLYKEYNYIPYINVYDDFKYNCLYSAYDYLKEKNTYNINLVFNLNKKNYHYLDCISSFVKRKFLNNLISNPFIGENFVFSYGQASDILCLSNFLIKTGLIYKKNFFDFVYNYYILYSQSKIDISNI